MDLISWEANIPSVLARRAQQLKEGNLQGVILLEYRYRRLKVPKDLRATIGLAGIAHLGLAPGGSAPVYVALVGELISIVSQEYRDRQIASAEASNLFEGLP